VGKGLGSKASRFAGKTVRRAYLRWKGRAKAGWKREIGIWRRTKRPPNRRHALGLLMLLITAPVMWWVAYNAGLIVALSFTFSAFMAISYATFFSSPFVFVLIYLGILVGQAANAYFFKAKDAAFAGDLTSAGLVALVGIGIWVFSNRLKEGEVMPRKPSRSRRTSRRKARRKVRA
jgi:hypothetical protein